MRSAGFWMAWIVLVGVTSCQTAVAQPVPPPSSPPSPQPAGADQAVHPVLVQLGQLLGEGKVAEALAYTAQQQRAHPDDQTIRKAYLELRMSIAREAIIAQKFAQAESLLKEVLAVEPTDRAAAGMVQEIASARGRIDQGLPDAEQLLRLERFEQAAAILAQAAGLIPDQPTRWQANWLTAAVGAGDDHYLMRNYEAALPFYTQALELMADAPAGAGADEPLLWRWAHCYVMNLAHTAGVQRSAVQWQTLIDQAKDRFTSARAQLLGQFLTALGRDNLGDYANAAAGYRDLLGAEAPIVPPNLTLQESASMLRQRATAYVDSLNRADRIGRRGGAWAAVLGGEPLVRKTGRVVVRAHNDLAARRVLEAIEYHAPRLAQYLGGTGADLNWEVPYEVTLQASMSDDARQAATAVPSYTRVVSQGPRLVSHQTICFQSDPLLLGATIPHELTHVLIHRLSGYAPVPLAVNEGLAIHAETTPRYLMFRRAVLDNGGAGLSVAQLLSATQLPPAGQRTRFYGECYNLVAWLLSDGPPAKVIQMCSLTKQLSPVEALLRTYPWPDLATAEVAYRAFLQGQGLVQASR